KEITIGQPGLTHAGFSSDGSRIVTASTSASAHSWDATNGQRLTAVGQPSGMFSMTSFSLDGSRIITIENMNALVWDATTGKKIATLATCNHSGFPRIGLIGLV